MLVSMLEGGEWQVEGNELVIKVASSPTVIDMTLGADARRLAIATASGVAGRALKLKVVPGNGTASGATPPSIFQRRGAQPGRTGSDCSPHEGKVWRGDSDDHRLQRETVKRASRLRASGISVDGKGRHGRIQHTGIDVAGEATI